MEDGTMSIRAIRLSVLCLIACCSAASARPRCDDGGFALVNGRWLSSKWCQEQLAARYSSKNGRGYTAAQLRNNPKAMEEFCHGNDNIEFTDACASQR
jgi:hypothetical protein